MTTAVPLDNDGRVWLYTSDEALNAINHTVPYSVLNRWVRDGHITPTQPPTGSGSATRWSPHDITALQAIAKVRNDLDSIGLPCPWKLVGELWDQLDTANTATITTPTVNITVHLEKEDR